MDEESSFSFTVCPGASSTNYIKKIKWKDFSLQKALKNKMWYIGKKYLQNCKFARFVSTVYKGFLNLMRKECII